MDSLGGHAFTATPRIPPSEKQENIVVIACVAFLILVSVKGAFGDRQQRITTFTWGAAFASACVVTYGFYRAQMDTNIYPAPHVIYVDASQGQIDAAAGTDGAGRPFLQRTGRGRIRPKTYLPVSFPGTGVQLALPDVREFDDMPAFVFAGSICLFLAYASFHYQDVDPSLKWLVLPGMFCLARFVHGFSSDQRQHLSGGTLRELRDRASAMRLDPADPKPRVGQPGHTGRR